jgi:deoxyribonuclease V
MVTFSALKAFKLQKFLASKVKWEGKLSDIKKVVGLDLAFLKDKGIGVAVLLSYPDLRPVKYVVVIDRIQLPYIPGLLAFREAPLMLLAYDLLNTDADLIFVDGHGVTHPRRFGIASHIGLVLDKASIGAAKKRLFGKIKEIDGRTYLIVDGKKAGLVVKARTGRTIYISIGHKIGIEELVRLTPTFFKGHSLPEPTYVADRISKEVKRNLAKKVER